MSKTIRISKTEDRIIEHLREEKEILTQELKKNNEMELLAAITNQTNYIRGRAAEKNLSLVKRMSEDEINFLWYIRSNREKLAASLGTIQNAQIHKLYNLICYGYSQTFEDLINGGMLSAQQRVEIRKAVESGERILITGAKDTGKTILLNAMLHEQPSTYLIVDALSELQTDALSHSMFLADIGDFSIRHFHMLTKGVVLVLADIHCSDDLFVLEHLAPATQLFGIIYNKEKLDDLATQWDHLMIIQMDCEGERKYVKNIIRKGRNDLC